MKGSEKMGFLSKVSLKVSLITFLSLIVLLIAFWYDWRTADDIINRIELTHESLLQIEDKVSVNPKTKIAIGFGSCVDLIAETRDVIFNRYSAPKTAKNHDIIETREEFLEVLAYFLQFGAAAERYITNSSLFSELVSAVNSGQRTKSSIGGNAPLMAIRFAKEGVGEVLLGAQMTPELQSQLPPDVVVSGPDLKQDEYHLLLEYPLGENWSHKYVSPRANRFIVHNDHQNPLLAPLDTFYEKTINFKPDLLVISGLHVMDNFPISFEKRKTRIETLKQRIIDLRKSHSNLRIHFEMGSYTEEVLLKTIVDQIFPIIDSIGLNEQEVNNLYNLYNYGNITVVSDPYPRVALVLDQIRYLYDLIHKQSSGLLTRIHVHTLAFQSILIKRDSNWKELMASSAKAALTAHRYTCGSEVIDINKAKLIMDESFSTTRLDINKKRIGFDVKNPVNCWNETISSDNSISICVAPVLVCTKVLQTGGAGDNVSAAGLVLQI